MGDLEIRFLLRQLGKINPAPGSEARVMDLQREWVRLQGQQHGGLETGEAGRAGRRRGWEIWRRGR